MSKLTLGFSPCPNDTFIFDALVNGKLDTGGLEFEVVLADVEELNQRALRGELDITKLSFNALMYCLKNYALLDSGAALGEGCGPLLISGPNSARLNPNDLKIAIPGERTTANFLMSYAFPKAQNKEAVLFSNIEEGVSNGTYDMGVIIHENRFTYEDRGLVQVKDLGSYWEQETKLPIPLGGIAIHRRVDSRTQQLFQNLLKQSVQYALDNPEQTEEYVRCHAQEMDRSVMYQHINLYVNDYTVTLGKRGEEAIRFMREELLQQEMPIDSETPIFLNS